MPSNCQGNYHQSAVWAFICHPTTKATITKVLYGLLYAIQLPGQLSPKCCMGFYMPSNYQGNYHQSTVWALICHPTTRATITKVLYGLSYAIQLSRQLSQKYRMGFNMPSNYQGKYHQSAVWAFICHSTIKATITKVLYGLSYAIQLIQLPGQISPKCCMGFHMPSN